LILEGFAPKVPKISFLNRISAARYPSGNFHVEQPPYATDPVPVPKAHRMKNRDFDAAKENNPPGKARADVFLKSLAELKGC